MNDSHEKKLSTLLEEKRKTEEIVRKLTEEINSKRRNLLEYNNKINTLDDKIKAKRLEIIAEKYGLEVDEFVEAVENGNVLVDTKESTSETDDNKVSDKTAATNEVGSRYNTK